MAGEGSVGLCHLPPPPLVPCVEQHLCPYLMTKNPYRVAEQIEAMRQRQASVLSLGDESELVQA